MISLAPSYLNSLKGRFTLFALTMALLVVAVSVVGHQNVKKISKETEVNFIHRNQLSIAINAIRSDLFEAYKALDAFLLDSTRTQSRDQAFYWLDQSIDRSTDLQSHAWFSIRNQESTIELVSNKLKSLKIAIKHLAQSKTQTGKQYPALGQGRSGLEQSQTQFNQAINTALKETKAAGYSNRNAKVYQGLVETRYVWNQMVSDFRLYLANRLGSYNLGGLKAQEKNIDKLYRELIASMQQLDFQSSNGLLGKKSKEALETLHRNSGRWHKNFSELKNTKKGQWRADAALIKEQIEPRLEEISRLLQMVDIQIKDTASRDFRTLTDVATLQTRILFVIASFGIIFLALTTVSLSRMVFKPIDAIAQALKAEAFGKEAQLPAARSEETQQLVDAFTEMRNQIRVRQNQLEYQALHDDLTKLPNRALLHDRMNHAIHVARRTHQHLSLLMMDLDGFKEVNDTLGHHVGDRLLTEVGKRLKHSLREMDTVARLGGDEFAILLPNTDAEQAKVTSEKILKEMASTIVVDEINLYVNASIGIANYPENGKDGSTLLQHADVAMYNAKRNKSGLSYYDSKNDEHSVGRLSLMSDLHNAIEQSNLELNYQPKFNMDSGTVVSVEALLRWEHPKFGAIPPDQIVSLAEQTKLINPLTQWIIKTATAQCAAWQKIGFDFGMAINLSAHNLKDPELPEHIKKCLKDQDLSAGQIILEITESSMMAHPAQVIETLKVLDKTGVRLAIDDFGTGFSSLTYLNQLPVDELKIDKSFIIDLEKNDNNKLIVRSTIELAHELGLTVVAEGVETPQIYRSLSSLGCDCAQGYFLSPPLKVSHLEKWLRTDSDIISQEIQKIQSAQNQ